MGPRWGVSSARPGRAEPPMGPRRGSRHGPDQLALEMVGGRPDDLYLGERSLEEAPVPVREMHELVGPRPAGRLARLLLRRALDQHLRRGPHLRPAALQGAP